MTESPRKQAWALDQITKSQFFHDKLHAWGVLEIAEQIEHIRGETLEWELDELRISQSAWRKVIHRGIMPIIVFAHPEVLGTVAKAVSYYRMLAMASQKSMNQLGLSVAQYEQSERLPDEQASLNIARRLNTIISTLIESDEDISAREFDLWRGMAAGSQAQGSWQNAKGSRAEVVIKSMVQRRLQKVGLLSAEEIRDDKTRHIHLALTDGRRVTLGDEPDIGFYENDQIMAAVEIKGGIDTAAILERVGASIKSLRRAKDENPHSVTILLIPSVSMTKQAENDLKANADVVNHWYTIEEILEDEEQRENLFSLLRI